MSKKLLIYSEVETDTDDEKPPQKKSKHYEDAGPPAGQTLKPGHAALVCFIGNSWNKLMRISFGKSKSCPEGISTLHDPILTESVSSLLGNGSDANMGNDSEKDFETFD